MAWATPIGGGSGGAFDIFLEHQPLFDELPRGRGDRANIGLGVRVALENRASRVAGPAPLFGGFRKWNVAAGKFMHGALTKAAGP